MGGSDFTSRNRAILAGEQATSAVLAALREKLAAARNRPATGGTVATQ
jgi:NTE family protein